MIARFDEEQPSVKIKDIGNGKTAVFLCSDGNWYEEETDSGTYRFWVMRANPLKPIDSM